jgi:hypothetical protein
MDERQYFVDAADVAALVAEIEALRAWLRSDLTISDAEIDEVLARPGALGGRGADETV